MNPSQKTSIEIEIESVQSKKRTQRSYPMKDVAQVSIWNGVVIIHHNDGTYSAFQAVEGDQRDGESAGIAWVDENLDVPILHDHGLITENQFKKWAEEAPQRRKAAQDNEDWVNFVRLARKYGVLLPEQILQQ